MLNAEWIVRFEDIDKPRVLPGTEETQLTDMRALGMVPDRIYLQSQNHERHWDIFCRALREGKVYPCFCSRKEVQAALLGAASAPHRPEAIYDGKCREHINSFSPKEAIAWRFKSHDTSGARDFIVARTKWPEPKAQEFVPSYHWACAIDDWDGQYSLLVRAWDLLSAAERQAEIKDWLNTSLEARRHNAIFHCSLVVGDKGERLEKRTKGVTLPELAMSKEQITSIFARSFHAQEYLPQKLWGEDQREILLSNLLALGRS